MRVERTYIHVYKDVNFGKFSPIHEGDCATFSAVSDTRCSTYLIFTAFLTAECSTVELPGSCATPLFSFYYSHRNHATSTAGSN